MTSRNVKYDAGVWCSRWFCAARGGASSPGQAILRFFRAFRSRSVPRVRSTHLFRSRFVP
jgi:hypothetical protein